MRNQETTEIRSKAKNYLSNLREIIKKKGTRKSSHEKWRKQILVVRIKININTGYYNGIIKVVYSNIGKYIRNIG